MPEASLLSSPPMSSARTKPALKRCRAVALWIDWYAYHVARFEALAQHPDLSGQVAGFEMIGGAGVHPGQTFRQTVPGHLPVETLLPGASWREAHHLALAKTIWRRLNRLNPDVVLVPGYYTAPALAAALWARLHRKKSVLMTESTEADHRRLRSKELVKGALLKTFFTWAIAGGHPHVRYLRTLGFPAHRIRRFYDVVDNHFFDTQTRDLRQNHSAAAFGLPPRYFLYVGRLAPEKNGHELLAAYFDYRAAGGTWPLVLVGDGPDAQALRHLASSSDYAASIFFAGHKSHRELPPYYAFAGCFLLPSTREPWGLVVNEAMASHLPVIVSHRCGCAEDLVLPGINGFLFDPENRSQLSECLASVSSLTPDALAHMGRRSSEQVALYSPEQWAAEVVRILNE